VCRILSRPPGTDCTAVTRARPAFSSVASIVALSAVTRIDTGTNQLDHAPGSALPRWPDRPARPYQTCEPSGSSGRPAGASAARSPAVTAGSTTPHQTTAGSRPGCSVSTMPVPPGIPMRCAFT
jgi:hypothetical protein